MRRSASGVPLESEEQQALIEWAGYQRWIDGRLIAIPNGTHLAGNVVQRFKQAHRLAREGVRPGVSDLFLAIPAHGFYGLWIEMKRRDPRLSVMTEDQRLWLISMIDSGYAAIITYGAQEAMRAILEYKDGKTAQLIPTDKRKLSNDEGKQQ